MPKVSPDAARKKTREWIALTMRGQGKKYREIGAELGCEESTAWTMVQEAVASISTEIRESAFDVLTLELQALNDLAARLWKKLGPDGCDAETVGSLLRIMERRAKYLGLDAPVDVRVGLYERGGDARQTANEIDIGLLSLDELEALERAKLEQLRILEKARKPVLALMAGDPVAVVPAPETA